VDARVVVKIHQIAQRFDEITTTLPEEEQPYARIMTQSWATNASTVLASQTQNPKILAHSKATRSSSDVWGNPSKVCLKQLELLDDLLVSKGKLPTVTVFDQQAGKDVTELKPGEGYRAIAIAAFSGPECVREQAVKEIAEEQGADQDDVVSGLHWLRMATTRMYYCRSSLLGRICPTLPPHLAALIFVKIECPRAWWAYLKCSELSFAAMDSITCVYVDPKSKSLANHLRHDSVEALRNPDGLGTAPERELLIPESQKEVLGFQRAESNDSGSDSDESDGGTVGSPSMFAQIRLASCLTKLLHKRLMKENYKFLKALHKALTKAGFTPPRFYLSSS